MFTGIVTALGTRPQHHARWAAARDMRLVIAAALAGYRADRRRRLDRLLRLLPDRGRARAGLVRRRRLGRDTEQDHARTLAGRHAGQSGALAAAGRRTGRPPRLRPCRWRRRGAVGDAGDTARRAGASASPPALARFIAVKGSVAVDGVSLTVNEVTDDTFGVNIIPHTAAVTSFGIAPARRCGQHRDRHAGPLCRAAGGVQVMHEPQDGRACRSTSPAPTS